MPVDVWRREERGCGPPPAALCCPAFAPCCSQLLQQRHVRPLKSALFLTMWRFNGAAQTENKYLLNVVLDVCSCGNTLRSATTSRVDVDFNTILQIFAHVLVGVVFILPCGAWGNIVSSPVCVNNLDRERLKTADSSSFASKMKRLQTFDFLFCLISVKRILDLLDKNKRSSGNSRIAWVMVLFRLLKYNHGFKVTLLSDY